MIYIIYLLQNNPSDAQSHTLLDINIAHLIRKIESVAKEKIFLTPNVTYVFALGKW